MAQFYPLSVVNKIRETEDAISISFQIPQDLKSTFAYTHGQYLTLRMNIGGEDVRRAYSLCSAPRQDDNLTVTVKRVDGGRMSTHLNAHLQIGQTIEVMPPEGRFFIPIDPTAERHYVLVAGGSGITPMMSILRTVLVEEPKSKVSLIYANRNAQSIIFAQKIQELQQSYGDRLQVQHFLDDDFGSNQAEKGPLTAPVLAETLTRLIQDNSQTHYFLCGPGGMMEQAKLGFESLNISTERIHIEYFTAPVSGGVTQTAPKPEAPAQGSKVIISLYGETHEVQIDDQTTILKAATKAGIDAPFSCEAGICSTCMAKVLEGSAVMDENNILSQDEVNDGYILTCQSHPTAPVVRIEYID